MNDSERGTDGLVLVALREDQQPEIFMGSRLDYSKEQTGMAAKQVHYAHYAIPWYMATTNKDRLRK